MESSLDEHTCDDVCCRRQRVHVLQIWPNSQHVATPACDGTKTPRGPHMLLQDTVLRDGSTRTARVWMCVAGHNILPTEQQTNCSQVDISNELIALLGGDNKLINPGRVQSHTAQG
jgi:hypothetical protein